MIQSSGRKSRRRPERAGAWAVIALWAAATVAAWAASPPKGDARFPSWPAGAAPATKIEDTRGEIRSLQSVFLRTPEDLNEADPLANAEFRTVPEGPAFERVRRISNGRLRIERLPSLAASTEVFTLGPSGRNVPPPPDWRRTFGGNGAWTAAVLAEPGPLTPYLNDAEFLWARDEASAAGPPREYLFRQAIDIPRADEVIRATLRVAGRAEILDLAVNDASVHSAGRSHWSVAEFEASQLLIEGRNIVSIWARRRPGPQGGEPSLGFHLEIHRLSPAPDRRRAPAQTLILERGGDRVEGTLAGFDSAGVRLETAHGRHEVPWEETEGLLFADGWIAPPEEKGLLRRLRRRFSPREAGGSLEPAGTGAPLRMAPEGLAGLVLLTGGRSVEAALSARNGETATLSSGTRRPFDVRLEEILALYPPAPAQPVPWRKPRGGMTALLARIRTVRGEVLTGLLRRLDRGGMILENRHGDFLKIRNGEWIDAEFPFHGPGRDAAREGPDRPRIALFGQASGLEETREDFNRLSLEVQEAAHLAGLDCRMIGQDELTVPGELDPAKYPAAVLADPAGEYPDTIVNEGDAREAIARYVERGGTLLLYSRGGALRTPVVNIGGRFLRETKPSPLALRFGLRVVDPGGAESSGPIRPFDRPANRPASLRMIRTEALAGELPGLPREWIVGAMPAAPFYPMAGPGGIETLYELTGPAGEPMGPALWTVRAGRGRIAAADHLLWHSGEGGEAFIRSCLPSILIWAARGEDGP